MQESAGPAVAPRHANRRRQWLFRLAALLGSMAVALVLVEVGLRLTRETDRYYPHHKNSLRVRHPQEEFMPGVRGVSHFTTNSLGCRGPEPAGEQTRLLTVGGSTTACSALDDSESWPHLVMKIVNAKKGEKRLWVTNSGINGKDSRHHVMHAKYLVPKIPDLDYVLVYCGLNDVGAWLYQEEFDPNYLEKAENWDHTIATSFRVSNYSPLDAPWYKKLELWKYAASLKVAMMSKKNSLDREQGVVVEDDEFVWLQEMQEHRRRAQKTRVHRAKMETLDSAVASYAANLRRIVEYTRLAGAKPIFMSQAIAWQSSSSEQKQLLWMGLMEGGSAYVREEQMEELVKTFNDATKKVCEELDVPFIDLPLALSGSKDLLFYDGCHLNERGSELVAQAVADFLIGEILQ